MPRVKGEDTAARIAKVAGELFYRHGVQSVGVDRIAVVANVTKRTIYKYFPTKDVLIAAGLRAYVLRFTRPTGTPAERIVDVFDQIAQWVKEPGFRGCPFLNAVVELSDPRHPGRLAVIEAKKKRFEWFQDRLVELGIDAHVFAAEQLMVIFDGAIATATIRGPQAAEAARDLVAQMVRRWERSKTLHSRPRMPHHEDSVASSAVAR